MWFLSVSSFASSLFICVSVGQRALCEPCKYVYQLTLTCFQSRCAEMSAAPASTVSHDKLCLPSCQWWCACRASRPGLWTHAECSSPFLALAISSFQVRCETSVLCFRYYNISKTTWKMFPSTLLGLLVAYCSRFDVQINSRNKVYFISCCIGTSALL